MFKLLILILLSHILSILVSMDKSTKKRCFSKYISIGDTLHLSFMVTGDEETQKTTVYLYDPDGVTIYEKLQAEDGEMNYEPSKDGNYKMCIFPGSDKGHFVSFEFYSKYEAGHTLNLAKDGNF
jgi:hypothetical protein